MPYSSKSGKAWIERLVMRFITICDHDSILDVGAGAGTYSDLFRARLPHTHFTALEIWEPYHSTFQLASKYDVLRTDDVRTFTPEKRYGITFLGDVLEHMTKGEALEVYEKLLAASDFVFISIPIIKYPQDSYMGNPYEKHVKDDWTHEEVLATFPHIAFSHVEQEIGAYVGVNPNTQSLDTVTKLYGPKIAVYALFDDNEADLGAFLHSVKAADQIVLCDTGSTDGSNEVVARFQANNPDVNLSVYPICVTPFRFDDARNTCLSLVSPEIDLCVALHANETLMEGWRDLLAAHWTYESPRYRYMVKKIGPEQRFTVKWHDWIHSRRGYTWKLPIHEVLQPNDPEQVTSIADLWVYRKEHNRRSHENDIPMLEQSLKEFGNYWKTWSYLAAEYMHNNRQMEALQAVNRALALPGNDSAYLYQLQFSIFRELGSVDQALLSLNNAISHLPNRREPHYIKAMYMHQLGRHLEAFLALKEAETKTERVFDDHDHPAAWDEEFEQWKAKLWSLSGIEGGNASE
ncbi:hypothetical protein EDM56_16100 [Brevibacillus fluminis]|uniref:Uncharacterized protein n=1 Tax=Brevibacillus fluminis TaxID=511487 RepID=A0A3M8DGF3_9BACL|nr:hypothetical protein [Brevibacillus fluminis]RNB87200.1 hypothetical protein EDM56_16100 [Brevibacillus fluminis]